MKKRHLILAVLAAVLVISASIGTSLAYFTTYSDAKGGYVIHLGHKTTIEEEVEGSTKVIRIQNKADTTEEDGKYPLFVRVKVFSGSDCTAELDSNKSSSGWTQSGDIYYYQDPLYAGVEPKAPQNITNPLYIKVNATNTNVKAGDTIDVVVVYESVPALFTANGDPDLATAWATGTISPIA